MRPGNEEPRHLAKVARPPTPSGAAVLPARTLTADRQPGFNHTARPTGALQGTANGHQGSGVFRDCPFVS